MVEDIRASSVLTLAGRTEVTQVLANLLANAADAMNGVGTVTVTLDQLRGERPQCRLTVRDTGCGIRPEVQQRVFEPFFTTKPIGQGTGLGLAVVHGIVGSWNGSITVDSTEGQGTTFEILIPLIKTPH